MLLSFLNWDTAANATYLGHSSSFTSVLPGNLWHNSIMSRKFASGFMDNIPRYSKNPIMMGFRAQFQPPAHGSVLSVRSKRRDMDE